MTAMLEHRGPDASGFYKSGNNNCFLGHRRLSIIDLSEGANQPMTDASNGYTIIYNGEIYNYRELRNELVEEHQVVFSTQSDTEVALQAFITWGDDFVRRLNGMFTIAVYHEKTNHLKLFRDRMGIKPLYYYYKDGVFAFASELKGLFPLAKAFGKFSLNKRAINYFFRLGYIPEPESIFEEIKKFPAGCEGIINDAGLEIVNFWKLEEKIVPTVLSDESAAKTKLKQLVESAVSDRLVSDVPFGVFLSGGIDSSLIAAVANHNHNAPLNTFSIGFKEASHNESQYAKAVAQHLKTDHHEFIIGYADALDLIERIPAMYDEPFADSSCIPTHLVAQVANKHVKMVLTGDGGDEQFLGYGMYNWAQRLYTIEKTGMSALLKNMLRLSNNRSKRAAAMFDRSNEEDIRAHIFSVEQYFFNAREWKQAVSPDYYTAISFPKYKTARKLSAREQQALFDLNYYLRDDLLVKVDRATMAASLEARTPLLDHRIVSFALNLDERLKIKGKDMKYLLKSVLYDYAPAQLFDRPKWGFSIPLNHWLGNELKSTITATLTKERMMESAVLNSEEILRLLDRFFRGETYLYNKIWLAFTYLKWEEKHAHLFR